MSGISKAICTRVARSSARACACASMTVFLFLATTGVASAEKKFHGENHRAAVGDAGKFDDARMVLDPSRLAAARQGFVPESTSSEILEGRLDDVAMIATLARYNLLESPMASNREAAYGASKSAFSRLPEPDGWTAVAATLALGVFFFLRRVA